GGGGAGRGGGGGGGGRGRGGGGGRGRWEGWGGGVGGVWDAASGPTSRPLGDTYRISGPHQACKVVAAAHHIKVDVLAHVEARVLFRPTEAGRVEIEHDQRRAAASHRLEKPNPLRVRARGDDRDGAPRQAPDPVPGEGLRQRCAPVGLAHGEVVEDEAILPHRTMRLEQ